MNKVYLLNAANMPQSGLYITKEITAEQWKSIFLKANEVVSSVSYKETAECVGKHLNIQIPIDTEKRLTKLNEDTCDLLIIKLRYRVKSERKGKKLGLHIDDYMFLHSKYYKTVKAYERSNKV